MCSRATGEVLDAYSINLIHQAEAQFLNPFPVFRFLDGDLSPGRIWRHLCHDRINYEYAEYCMKAMLWHGTGGLDAYLDSPPFLENCRAIIARKTRRDPLLAVLHPLFADFLPELIRAAATTHALGQFWRVMSDLFLDLARAEAAGQVQPVRLIATDTHPGNWLLRHGQAVLVDWEKGQYSSPAVDLAHASLYTSTTWDVVAAGAPTLAAIAAFYQHWLEAAAPDLATQLRPWLLPLRRLVWLRAVTWCVKWRAASRQARRLEQPSSATSTEDWSAERSDAALVAHVQNRVDHYLDPAIMATVRQEWALGSPLQYL